MSEQNSNPNQQIQVQSDSEITPRVDLTSLTGEEKAELWRKVKNGYLAGFNFAQLDRMYGVSQSTIRNVAHRDFWDVEKQEHDKTHLMILNASNVELLGKSSENLSKLIYIMTKEGFDALKAGNSLPKSFNMKVLTDALDKLQRLEMHVATGGVQKTAHINIDVNQSLIQDVIMEVCIELENLYPNLNSRDLVKKIFDKYLNQMIGKVK